MQEASKSQANDEDTPIEKPKSKGEGKKAKGSDGQKHRKEAKASKQEQQARAKRKEEEAKWRKDIEDKVTSKDQKIQFKEAKTAVEVVRAFQEVSEKGKVLIDSKELAELENLLSKYLDPETIKRMSDGEIVSAVQIVLKNSQIVVSEEDLSGISGPQKKAEEKLLKAYINEAQTGEILDPDKITHHLEVIEEFEKMIDKSGPGTTEGTPTEEDWTEALPNED